jgi:hypothetical protein
MRPFYFSIVSITLLSCSGGGNGDSIRGPIPPPSQASLFFSIGAGCGTPGSYVGKIGGPPRSSLADPGVREVNGETDSRITCRVSGTTTFELSANAEKGATAFVVRNGVVEQDGVGTATLSMAAQQSAGAMLTSAEAGCVLDVSRQPFQVAPGNVWARFDCPAVTSPNMPGATCTATGEFVFENCELEH